MEINENHTPLTVYSLFSGSKGNCFYIRSGEDELLIDCGGSAKATETELNRIGTSLTKIKAIFITHEHSDHTAGLRVISKKYGIPIHISLRSAVAMSLPEDSPEKKNMVTHDPLFSMNIGEINVRSFITPHDSAMCLGYVITSPSGKCGIATDCGKVTKNVMESLLGCECIILESNHDPEMLRNGPYPLLLKQRVGSEMGHLSNPDCAKCLAELSRHGTKRMMLAHLSAENNKPELALETVRRALKEAGSDGCDVVVAAPAGETRLV